MKLENMKLKNSISEKNIFSLIWKEKNTQRLNCGAGLINPFDFEFSLCNREESIEALTMS